MELICKKLQSFLMVRWTISQDQKAPEIFHEDSVQFSSVTQSCPTLRPHESWHARSPCPSPTPRVYSNSCPLSQFGWHHQLMRTKSPLKQTQGSRPSPEGNPEGSVMRNGIFVSLVFQSRAKSGMPGEEKLGIYGRKNKILTFWQSVQGTCRATWCFDCDTVYTFFPPCPSSWTYISPHTMYTWNCLLPCCASSAN